MTSGCRETGRERNYEVMKEAALGLFRIKKKTAHQCIGLCQGSRDLEEAGNRAVEPRK
ncbi:hypothetical protein P7K49_031916, partial [Saguinus oedipus]